MTPQEKLACRQTIYNGKSDLAQAIYRNRQRRIRDLITLAKAQLRNARQVKRWEMNDRGYRQDAKDSLTKAKALRNLMYGYAP